MKTAPLDLATPTVLTSSITRLLLFAPFLLAACTTSEPAPPNVLFVMVDDLRLNIEDTNQPNTPAIDDLAAGGVRFTHSYVNVPVCGASRASILTGLRPKPDRFVNY